MAHLFQVGAGSGGMAVLDALARDPRIHRVTLVEPDIFKPHNVERHLCAAADVGEFKGVLAERWLKDRRPDLDVQILLEDVLAPSARSKLEEIAATCDLGVCAADNEPVKYFWDALMRRHAKPWTLGEVLGGGIGGFVHWFRPGGPCYGCVASHLQRSPVVIEKGRAPNYADPDAAVEETRVPASKASIQAISALHALITLALLDDPAAYNPGFASLLLTLQRVPDVFDEAFRPYRFQVSRRADCLICRPEPTAVPASAEELDVALDQALARLGNG